MHEETRAAFDAACEAGEVAHLLTVGSSVRGLAFRVSRGRLDRRGRWHPRQLDAFLIWQGCRYGNRQLVWRARWDLAQRAVRLVPRWLRYRVVISTAAAVSVANPTQEVPTITWSEMAASLEG